MTSRGRWSAILAVALCCTLARAIDPPTTAPSSEPTTGMVTGTVLDAQGHPTGDCIVTLQQSAEKMRDPIQTTTDDKGAFKFENIPEGEYNLNARTRDLKQKAIRTVAVFSGKTTKVSNLKLKAK